MMLADYLLWISSVIGSACLSVYMFHVGKADAGWGLILWSVFLLFFVGSAFISEQEVVEDA